MFDRIAPRYDRLNRALSFGTDRSWRRRAVELARLGPGEVALDVGAGTGDLALRLLRASAPDARAIGLDLSGRMLAISRARLSRAGLGGRYTALLASAEALPLPDASVDRVVSGFTLRNVGDLPRALAEMRRVLRPQGRAVLLELSHPPNRAFRALYLFYFERVLPPLASLLGGDPDAYRYLPRSLRPFPDAERLSAMLREAGFGAVCHERLSFGVAAVHVAEPLAADAALAAAPEILVVLGSKRSQVARAEAAAALARERPGAVVILSGRAGFEPPQGPAEAEIMAGVLRQAGIPGERLRLEDESRDTVGNAVLTAARYLRGIAPRPLTLVTSPFHMERALYIFRTVLGPSWPVTGDPSRPLPGDEDQIPLEATYLDEVRTMLAGIEPGDLAAIAARLRDRWPEYYGDIERLASASKS